MEYMILQASTKWDSKGYPNGIKPIGVLELNKLALEGWRVVSAQFAEGGPSHALLERESQP